jgi:hypothetical protein
MADEPWVEKVIREGIESGRLQPSEGIGEPIPDLERPRDPLWWVKRWVERERLRDAAEPRDWEVAAGPDAGEAS